MVIRDLDTVCPLADLLSSSDLQVTNVMLWFLVLLQHAQSMMYTTLCCATLCTVQS